VLDGYFKVAKKDQELMALYRLAEDVGVLKDPRQYIDMTQALVIGGFGIEGERIMQQGITANIFTGDDLTRAKRTLEAATRKAQAERALLPKAGAQLAAAKSGADADTIGKLYFSAGNYAHGRGALQKAVAMGGAPDADAPACCWALRRNGRATRPPR
jgi:hypothetical protein